MDSRQVAIGLAVMAIGVLLLLRPEGLFWPIVVIGIGIAKFAKPKPDGHRDGGWLVVLGVWLVLNELDVLRYHQSWPLLLLAFGVSILWKAVNRSSAPPAPPAGS